jgi:anti-sigma factor RsiW
MRCQDVQIKLRAYSIGELPMDVRQTIQAHVSECGACRAELAKIDPLTGVLAAAQTPPIPPRVLPLACSRDWTGTPRRRGSSGLWAGSSPAVDQAIFLYNSRCLHRSLNFKTPDCVHNKAS